jgi:hypothetical protein
MMIWSRLPVALAFLGAIVMSASAQSDVQRTDRPTGNTAKGRTWSYMHGEGSPLNPRPMDYFAIEGTFVSRPTRLTEEPPTLAIVCSNGKFQSGHLDLHDIIYSDYKYGPTVEVRWDDKPKADRYYMNSGFNPDWSVPPSGDALLFNLNVLRALLLGDNNKRYFYTKKPPLKLVRELYIGAENAFRQSIIVRFDMPDDISQMVEICGLK